MQLMKPAEFQKKYFEEGSAPDLKTIRSDIDKCDLPGKVIGNRYYVDAEAFEKESTTHDLVTQVMQWTNNPNHQYPYLKACMKSLSGLLAMAFYVASWVSYFLSGQWHLLLIITQRKTALTATNARVWAYTLITKRGVNTYQRLVVACIRVKPV